MHSTDPPDDDSSHTPRALIDDVEVESDIEPVILFITIDCTDDDGANVDVWFSPSLSVMVTDRW